MPAPLAPAQPPGQAPARILTAPAGSTLPPEQRTRIAAAARQFEAMAIGQLLQPMFDTVDTGKGLFGGGNGEDAWKPMLVTELAKQISKAGGLGLAQPIMQQMLRLQEAR